MLLNEPNWIAAAKGAEPAQAAGLCLQAVLRAPDFAQAATACATELAAQLGCQRVALGWLSGPRMQVVAVSHGADLDRQAALIDVTEAMAETALQGVSLTLPLAADGLPRITLAHQALLRSQALGSVVSVPLAHNAEVQGVLLCERGADQPAFETRDVLLLEQVAAGVAPVLRLQRALAEPLGERLRRAGRSLVARWRDPSQRLLRGSTYGALALLAALLAVPLPHRVSATARLEGAVQRVLGAPQDGYLRQVHVRPGDMVKEGQVLAELSDEEMQLMRRAKQAELAQHENTFAEAFSRGDRAQAAVAQAKAMEARAQFELAQEQLGRMQLKAPFDGVVIDGDLSQQLGAPLKRGEALLTLAPDERFRIMLEVPERDIADMQIGQRGSLLLSALPQRPVELKVVRITPVAKTVEGGCATSWRPSR